MRYTPPWCRVVCECRADRAARRTSRLRGHRWLSHRARSVATISQTELNRFTHSCARRRCRRLLSYGGWQRILTTPLSDGRWQRILAGPRLTQSPAVARMRLALHPRVALQLLGFPDLRFDPTRPDCPRALGHGARARSRRKRASALWVEQDVESFRRLQKNAGRCLSIRQRPLSDFDRLCGAGDALGGDVGPSLACAGARLRSRPLLGMGYRSNGCWMGLFLRERRCYRRCPLRDASAIAVARREIQAVPHRGEHRELRC
jgi:hypothetical protein